LEIKALPLDAVHKDGVMELDLHSLYGTQQTMATNKWFEERKMRSMIIERSSYSGSGKYGSMWLGPN
jgi:alpha-glucosidase